jgi:signal transduction histidine kinase
VSRSLVAEIVLESTSESVTEYARLLQSEAAARAREMEAAILELRESERVRGQVLREAAHDLRGGLGIVSGSASLIDLEQLPEDDRAEVGRILRRGVHSLQEMMTDLIDLARLEAGEERAAQAPYDVGELMRELCNTAAPLARDKGLVLTWDGPDELPAEGDPVKVRRVAQNLLLNAIKYTSQGSVALSWAPDGDDRWLLCVRDTGPGLDRSPAAPLARAMESATSTARKVEGRTEAEQNPTAHPTPASQIPDNACATGATGAATTAQAAAIGAEAGTSSAAPSGVPGEGVGLAIVKRLCDLLGASIELDTRHSTPENRSNQSSGSTFRVLFPRFVAPLGERKPAPLETGASLSVETVLNP